MSITSCPTGDKNRMQGVSQLQGNRQRLSMQSGGQHFAAERGKRQPA